MAATYGRLTGKPGVCLTTLGPGALNLTTGAAYAQLGAMPMVMITGQKGVMSSRQARFQIVDVVSVMKPLTKLARQIVAPAMIPTMVREAFRVAQQERPGPVHLELPEDIAAQELRDGGHGPIPPDRTARAEPRRRSTAAAHDPRGRAAAGHARRRGLPAARRAPISPDFVVRLQIPFFTTQMGKGTVPGGTELYMGTAALSERDYVHEAIERADLIITIGHDTVEKPPFIMGPDGPQVIHIGYQPASVEQVYFPQAEVIGDLGTIPAAARRAAWRARSRTPRHCCRCASGILDPDRRARDRGPASRPSGWCTTSARSCRRTASSRSTTACTRSGSRATTAPGSPTRCCSTTRSRPWARACPPAIMAALLYPDRRVMAVCGDGGFMMNSQELETAVRLKLNLVVLVIEDNAFGMIRWKQAVDGFPDFGMTFGNPDFVAYAESLRRHGPRVSSDRRFCARRSRRPSRAAASTSSPCRSTIRKTSGSSSMSFAR